MRQCSAWVRYIVPAVVLAILCQPAFSQGGASALDIEKLSSSSKALSSSSALLTAEQIPTDDIVDPSIYRLGPGDVLAYQTNGIDFTEKMTVVSPENTVMIDRIGLVPVGQLTLAQFRDTLKSVFKQRSQTVEVYVTLRRARTVYVTLSGNMTFPGTYAVPASMRVSTFVNIMRQPWLLSRDGGLSELARSTNAATSVPSRTPEFARTNSPFLGPYAMRNILVRHRKGVSYVDIPKSRVDGFSHLDPHLREGDEVIVPVEVPSAQTITIAGAVVNPVTLAYKAGDKLSVLLAAAGGFTDIADRGSVTLVNSPNGPSTPVRVNDDFSLASEDVELAPGATMIVETTRPDGNRDFGVVQVYGEVANPGAFPIASGITKVASVIQQAGGTTANAALGLSYVVRPEVAPGTQLQLRDEANKTFQYSDLKLEDTTRYHFDQKYRMPYVSSDLAKALADTMSLDNIVLRGGDVIVIASTPDRVYVYGQVLRPGYVPYSSGKRLEWYVERAGGYATGAEKDRARIIRGRSKVWVEEDDNVVVEPGDEVYVPRPADVPINTEIQTYSVIASIAASVGLLAATVISLFR